MGILNVTIAVVFLLVILYVVVQIFLKPIKLLWKLLLNSALGLLLLMLTNYIAAYFSFSLPINVITVLIAGFLGIPGILLLIAFQIMML